MDAAALEHYQKDAALLISQKNYLVKMSQTIEMIDVKSPPIVVDMDGTLLKIDTLFELFAACLFFHPLLTLRAVVGLKRGISEFKKSLSDIAQLDIETIPVRDELVTYLQRQSDLGRDIHLATAADQRIATQVAERFPFFRSAIGTENGVNLKGENKASRLNQLFPTGYVYAGDSTADVSVWKSASAAIVVSSSKSLSASVRSLGVPIERSFGEKSVQPRAWIRACRPHQWAKNTVVLVPLLLGWRDVTPLSLLTTLVMMVILGVAASATYMINDMADLASDRRHWSKKRRPFASGAIPVRDGLIVAGLVLPLACLAALIVEPLAGLCLVFYVFVTLAYSFGWKRIPLFDTFIIALLFTIRILIGISAAKLAPSAWLLTFSMLFFFSLALAKRHTEILRAAEHAQQKLAGRGYETGDASLTLTFGTAAAMASIVIVVIYLVDEVFARQLYRTPAWLWIAPIAIFLFVCRIWVLSHRGRMTDDPVAFALRDRVSVALGVFVGIAILLAL